MHDQPAWVNNLLFPLAIKNKWMEPSMNNRLAALIKCIAELRQTDLEVCHCIEEFHLWRIHPLDHRKTLAFKCLWMADPSFNPSEGDLFILSSDC
jgi:hypothetical protein